MPKPKKTKKNTNEYKKYYSSSSEAYRIEEEYEQVRLPAKKIKRTKRITKKVGTRYKYEIDSKIRLSFITYITILVLFVGGISNLIMLANITYKGIKIESLISQLKQASEDNTNLKLEIASNYNLSEIEKIATSKLGMLRPQPHQLIHITIDRSNNVTHGESVSVTNPKKTSFFDKFFNKAVR